MNQINILDPETIDKIAAGEVVERPASVVKELIENSIDAGADAVTVEIKDGGKSMIRVSDNGKGISPEDVPIAFMRHTTSKISSSADLDHIASFGFRGEALSSIAAVSRVELITRDKESITAVRYVCEGGKEISSSEIGAPYGSTFIVRDLFFNTPAREKFLKTAASEASSVISVVENLALSHPDVSMTLITDGKKRLFTSGSGNLLECAYQVYGRDITRAMIRISAECPLASVEGYLGRPVISRGNRSFELFFVNGRYVHSTLLSKATEEGYRGMLMQHRYPFVLLNVRTDPSLVDVNVHPQKLEVRFSDQAEIYDEVMQAVRRALTQNDRIEKAPAVSEAAVREKIIPEVTEKEITIPQAFEEKRIKEEVIRKPLIKDIAPEPDYAQADLFEKTPEIKKNVRIIGQTLGTYILFEYDGEFFICDQHAAHEKVMYEKFLRSYREKTVHTQQIIPRMIQLSPSQKIVFEECLEKLADLGFEIEEFGKGEYRVCGVPSDIFGADTDDLFREITDDIAAGGRRDPETVLEKIALRSCKSAVKANDRLSLTEQQALISQLMTLDDPYRCPHGRPTVIKYTRYDLDRQFNRIV